MWVDEIHILRAFHFQETCVRVDAVVTLNHLLFAFFHTILFVINFYANSAASKTIQFLNVDKFPFEKCLLSAKTNDNSKKIKKRKKMKNQMKNGKKHYGLFAVRLLCIKRKDIGFIFTLSGEVFSIFLFRVLDICFFLLLLLVLSLVNKHKILLSDRCTRKCLSLSLHNLVTVSFVLLSLLYFYFSCVFFSRSTQLYSFTRLLSIDELYLCIHEQCCVKVVLLHVYDVLYTIFLHFHKYKYIHNDTQSQCVNQVGWLLGLSAFPCFSLFFYSTLFFC